VGMVAACRVIGTSPVCIRVLLAFEDPAHTNVHVGDGRCLTLSWCCRLRGLHGCRQRSMPVHVTSCACLHKLLCLGGISPLWAAHCMAVHLAVPDLHPLIPRGKRKMSLPAD